MNKEALKYNEDLVQGLCDVMVRVEDNDRYVLRDLKKISRKIALRIIAIKKSNRKK